MRRLSAFLMIAALVAALVPSAAFAAKPVPGIDSVVVVCTGLFPATTDCEVSVTVTFHGRAHRAKITETGGTADVLIYAWANNKAGTANVGYRLGRTKLGTYDFSWKVMLVDRKGRSLGAEVQTNDDKWFDGTTCPTAGTELAKYPITG